MNSNGAGGLRIETDIAFARHGDSDLLLDVYHPLPASEKRTAIIEVYGGGFTQGDKTGHYNGVFQRFAERGYVVVAGQYRLAGVAKWPAQIEDVKAVVRWTRRNAERLDVDPEKIVLAGYSAGGQVALVCAGTPDEVEGVSSTVAACVAYYPSFLQRTPEGADHPVMPESSSDADYDATNPLTYASRDFPPTILLCGTSDIFAAPTKRLFEAMQENEVPSELHLMAGLPHIYDRVPGFAAVCTELCDLFLDRYVVNPREYPAYRRPASPVTSA
jgi:acetyl esterase/lipase